MGMDNFYKEIWSIKKIPVGSQNCLNLGLKMVAGIQILPINSSIIFCFKHI